MTNRPQKKRRRIKKARLQQLQQTYLYKWKAYGHHRVIRRLCKWWKKTRLKRGLTRTILIIYPINKYYWRWWDWPKWPKPRGRCIILK